MTENIHAATLIRAVEEASSPGRLIEAVQQLAAARLKTAVPTLIEVLGYNNPGAAVAAVDGLIQLGDDAVPLLLERLDDHNYGARAWAVRALAGIGDPRGLETLLVAAKTDFALSVRRAAAKGLGTLRWHLLPEVEIQSAQAQALEGLLEVTQDVEWIVRYAAVVGLEALAIAIIDQPHPVKSIWQQLDHLGQSDPVLAVQTRVRFAQQQLQNQLGDKVLL